MNLDRGQLPPELIPQGLQLRIYPLSEIESEDVRQKGANPDEYVSVQWECPKLDFAGFSEKGEFLMQAWFLVPPGFLKHQAGPTILGPDGEPLFDPQKIQNSFFPWSLPKLRALVRRDDLGAEVPVPALQPTEEEGPKEEG